MQPIRLGMIGTGNWAREGHLKNLLRVRDEAEVVAFWNRGAENLHRATALAPSARVVQHWDELLDDPSIDGIIVTLPPHLNEEPVTRALRAGKHVLCDKPLSNTTEACERMVSAANSCGRILQVGFELRYSEFYQTFRGFIDEGRIGSPAYIVFKSFSGVGWAYREGTWIVDPQLSGGVMNSWGVHPIDLLNDLAGAQPCAVYAAGDVKVRTQTPMQDNATAVIEYTNGVIATLLYCRFSPYGNDWELNVIGNRGKIDGMVNRREVRHFGVENDAETLVNLEPYEGDGFMGAQGQMRAFLHAVRTGEQPVTHGQAGLRATQVALAMAESMKQRRRIPIA